MKNDNVSDLLQQDGYTYFAFISYRRTDSAWAAWLKRRLQSYRLPQRTHKKHQELPSRFSSVFLDKTNLTPGLLNEGLRAEVQASKYLIVICSRSAREKPEYLDAEIQYFLDGGGDASRIIPFIVDDAPRPEVECFPPRLQALCEEQTILGANIYDSGKRSAFLKVIAYMHGLKLEEIESDDQRRRRRTKFIAAAASLAVLCAAAFIGYRVWDYNRLKTNYYLDYAEHWGIPEGIEPLSGRTLEGAGRRYAILTSRNKVRELRYEDSYGHLLSHSGAADHDRPTRAVYEYAEDETLEKVSWYDAAGELVVVMNYANQQTVDLQYEQSDSYVGSASLRASNPLTDSAASPVIKNVTRWLLDYDGNGCVTELRYVSNPAYNDAAFDPDGVGGLRYERDELGRVSRLWYLTCVSERGNARYAEDYGIVGLQNGVAGMEFRYNERNELEAYTYLDVSGEPIRCSRGYATVKLQYDAHRNPTENRYYDTQGEPVYQTGGFAVYALEYDGRGNRTDLHFYGPDGEAAVNTDGYAASKVNYDSAGNLTEAYFYGADGELTATAWGYAAFQMDYDAEGRLLRQSWYDADGAPTEGEDGACAQSWQYDEAGRITQTVYYGADGQRCLNGSCAEKRLSYDEQGRCERMEFFGTDGKPCLIPDGYSAFTQRYDEQGNLVQICFFGTDGAPICNADGIAQIQKGYDVRGNLVSEHYFGTGGESALCAEGYAAVSYAYDDAGNVLEVCYLGTDGEPILLPAGFAMMRASYDLRGNQTEVGYYDTAQALLLQPEGYALVRFANDARGNLQRVSCYGADGRPTLCADGYFAKELKYNANGQLIQTAYFDTEEMPVLSTDGYAYALYVYDDAGRLTAEGYFDADEQPISSSGGYAFANRFYSESGQLIQVDFYDVDSNYIGSQTDFGD